MIYNLYTLLLVLGIGKHSCKFEESGPNRNIVYYHAIIYYVRRLILLMVSICFEDDL